jgi:hypothetical protein
MGYGPSVDGGYGKSDATRLALNATIARMMPFQNLSWYAL